MQFPTGFNVSSANIGVTSNTTPVTVDSGTSGSLTHDNRFWAYPTVFGDFNCAGAPCIAKATGV
jgi:hypothetical protein